jgi:heme exporter protein B
MVLVEAICLPVFTAFFNFGVVSLDVAVIALLGTFGFAAVGTLFSAMAVNTRARDVMLPLLVFPISVPVVIAAVEATSRVFAGDPSGDRLRWLGLLAAFDVIFCLLCFVVFDFVVEE